MIAESRERWLVLSDRLKHCLAGRRMHAVASRLLRSGSADVNKRVAEENRDFGFAPKAFASIKSLICGLQHLLQILSAF